MGNMIPNMYLASAISKIPFSPDSKFQVSRYEKAIMYPRNQSNGSKICTRPGQRLGKQSVFQNIFIFSGPSPAGGWTNYLPIFDRV